MLEELLDKQYKDQGSLLFSGQLEDASWNHASFKIVLKLSQIYIHALQT